MIHIQEMYSMFQLNENEIVSCEGMDVHFFYPVGEDKENNKFGKDNVYPTLRKLCANCDVLDKCRDWAIKHEDWGFWGGMSMYERRQYRKKYNIRLDQPWAADFLRGINK
jgi:hypothetical protein